MSAYSNNYFGNSGGEQLSQQTLAQLEAIPTANWANLMLLNQPVATTSSPRFFDLTITDAIKLQDPGVGTNYIALAAPALTGNRVVTFPDADVNFANIPNQAVNTTSTPQFATLNLTTAGGLTVNSKAPTDAQWGYIIGSNQALASTSTPQFAKLGINQAAGTDALEVNGNIKTVGAGQQLITNAGTAAGGSAVPHWSLSSGGFDRFSWRLENLEAGANAGSDLVLLRHNDAGGYNGHSMIIQRSSGNVGIGNTPTVKFDVFGGMRAETLNLTTAGGLTVNSKTPTDAQWGYITGLNQALATTSTSQFAKIGVNQLHSGGADVLEVNGFALAASGFKSNAGTSALGGVSHVILQDGGVPKFSIGMSGSGGDFMLYNHATPLQAINIAQATNYVSINSTRVGINQAAATEALEVNGTTKATALNATTAGGLTIGTRTPTDTQWSYLTGLNQALATSSTTQFAKLGINQANTGGSFVLEVNGPTFAKNYYQCDAGGGGAYQFRMSEAGVPKWSWLLINADCDLALTNETTSTNSLVIDSTTNYLTITCPRVGINQAAGTEALEVNGNIRTTGAGQQLITNAGTAGSGSAVTHWQLQSGNSSRWRFTLENSETGANAGSDLTLLSSDDSGGYLNTNLIIQRSTGNVGVFKIPTERLDVNGNIKASYLYATRAYLTSSSADTDIRTTGGTPMTNADADIYYVFASEIHYAFSVTTYYTAVAGTGVIYIPQSALSPDVLEGETLAGRIGVRPFLLIYSSGLAGGGRGWYLMITDGTGGLALESDLPTGTQSGSFNGIVRHTNLI